MMIMMIMIIIIIITEQKAETELITSLQSFCWVRICACNIAGGLA